jgi:hypothetical protein
MQMPVTAAISGMVVALNDSRRSLWPDISREKNDMGSLVNKTIRHAAPGKLPDCDAGIATWCRR